MELISESISKTGKNTSDIHSVLNNDQLWKVKVHLDLLIFSKHNQEGHAISYG